MTGRLRMRSCCYSSDVEMLVSAVVKKVGITAAAA